MLCSPFLTSEGASRLKTEHVIGAQALPQLPHLIIVYFSFSDIAIIKLEPLVSIRPWWPMHRARGRRNHIEFTDLRKHYMQR